jgi:uncharacterized membrane protein
MRGRLSNSSGKSAAQAVGQRWPLVAVSACMAFYIAYFCWYTFRSNDLYMMRGWDIGIYDQSVWNTIHGRWFRSTSEEGWNNLLADHVEPILLPISLLYFIWADPKMLLLVQTVGLALGALPVYWLAHDGLQAALRRRSPPGTVWEAGTLPSGACSGWLVELAAVTFALAYLLQPALHSANAFEFHPSVLAVPFLLSALHFMRQRRPVPFLIFILLAMSTKEVLPLTTFAVGVYVLLIRREWKLGVITLGVSALWFVLAVFVVVPHFNATGQSKYFNWSYAWLGASGAQILVQVLTHPGLVWQRLASVTTPPYLAGLLGPLGYVSVLGLPVVLLAGPALVLNALSNASPQYSLGSYFHYAVAIVPFIVVAAIDGTTLLIHGAGWLTDRLRVRLWVDHARRGTAVLVPGLILVASLLAQWHHGYLPFSRDYYLRSDPQRVAAIRQIVRQVTPVASVSTDLYPNQGLSHRQDFYLYPALHDADCAVIDVGYREGPFPPRDRYDAIQDLLRRGQYGVRDGRYGILFLERGLNRPAIPDRFYDFARAQNPSPQFKTVVDFGEDLQLIGFDLVWERPLFPRAYLVLYWRLLRPVTGDLRLFSVNLDASGQPVPSTEMEFVTSVWYSPSRWSPDEVIRTETPRCNLETPRQVGVGIGVVDGPGFWDLDKRLRPTVQSGPWTMPRVHGDGLLWLANIAADGQFASFEAPGNLRPLDSP